MRKAQKNGIRKVKNNSDIQKIRSQIKHELRRELKTKWQDPVYLRTNKNAQITFKGYKTPIQIKARVKKMKNKKVKGSASLSSLWS
jgi:hypothetical protein